MFGNVLSAVILGVDTHKVMVEADISAGLPGFSIVGVSSAQGRKHRNGSAPLYETRAFICRPGKSQSIWLPRR